MAHGGGSPAPSALDLKRDRLTAVVQSLRKETEDLKRQQRKAKHYEYRVDAEKLPRLREVGLEVTPGGEVVKLPEHATRSPRVPAHSPMRGRRSPDTDGGEGSGDEDVGMKTGKAYDAREASRREIGGGGVDEYDPKEEAKKAVLKEQKEVCALRDTASTLRDSVRRAEKDLAAVSARLRQVKMEDDVEEQRQKGQREIEKAKAKHADMVAKKEDAEWYSESLKHMVRRLRDEQVDHRHVMETFEDALRVQRNEKRLQDRHLAVAREELKKEEEELKKVMEFHRKQKKELEIRLEARQQHVAAHKRQQEEKEKRVQEDRALRARMDGDLTADEEQKLQARSKSIRAEVVELAKRVRFNINLADQLDTEYNTVRVAAGVPVSKTRIRISEDDPGFLKPEPHLIVHRFRVMQDDIVQVNEQLDDLTRRHAHLSKLRDRFKSRMEPRAREGSVDGSRGERVEYMRRIDEGRRKLETARAERDRLERLRVQLSQAIDGVYQRSLSSAVKVSKKDKVPTDVPTGLAEWALDAVTHLSTALTYLTTVKDRVEEAELEEAGEEGFVEDEESRILDATMQSMVVHNEYGIRIRPRSSTTGGVVEEEPFLLQDFTNAVHKIANGQQRKKGGGGEGGGTGHGHGNGHGHAGHGHSRRRGGLGDTGGGEVGEEDGGTEGKDEEARTGMKQMRTKEIQRYLAAAVAMAGGDVRDDAIRGTADDEDSEEELTWDKVKRSAEITVAAGQREEEMAEAERRRHRSDLY